MDDPNANALMQFISLVAFSLPLQIPSGKCGAMDTVYCAKLDK